MTRIGIVGLGFMAATHIKAYRQVPDAKIAALCNPSGRHLNGDFTGVAGNVGTNEPVVLDMTGVAAYRSFEELLADQSIDAIDICAPTVTHLPLATAALAAGKHVLCEKPLARTSAEGRQIAAAAKKSGKVFMPAMCVRFWPQWAWLKAMIASGIYGKVLSARFRRVAEPPAWGATHFPDGSKSGGALLDLHIHDVDFVQYCFGRPLSVFSTGYTKFSGAIDHVVTQYDVKSGAIVHAEGGWAMTAGFGFSMSYTVNFERATADYDIAREANALKVCVEGESARFLSFDSPDGYVLELRHFVECVRSGTESRVVTADDAVQSVEICEAEERSVKSRAAENL